MRNLIPYFIEKQIHEGLSNGEFLAYTMFIDLSGFTALTEYMTNLGNEGAEKLSITLNKIFEPMVKLVYKEGGFIPYFAGDAFTGIFPFEESHINPELLLSTASQIEDLFKRENALFTDFPIGIKIGLSVGEVEWGIIGDSPKSFYFRGPAIYSCAESQKIASQSEIIWDNKLMTHLSLAEKHFEVKTPGYYKLVKKVPVESDSFADYDNPSLNLQTLELFVPTEVIEYNDIGEFRTVVSVFISFEGVETHESLNEFGTIVLDQIQNFSGYFKEVDFGDKGGVMFGLFGAPVSFENNVERALEFIQTVRDIVSQNKKLDSIKFKVGMTSGLAYTGIVGGEERCQYAAVGNRVNLASRLMGYADWGEVLVDGNIQKSKGFAFNLKGNLKYKGIKKEIPTHRFLGKDTIGQEEYSSKLISRDIELKQLNLFAEPIFKNNFAGLAYIYGEAGIGKSRLVFELKQTLRVNSKFIWLTCQADQILKKPFNPFVYFLKNFYFQAPDNSPEVNKDFFEKRQRKLIKELSHCTHQDRGLVIKELERTHSILAAQIGMHYANSIWEKLDGKGRYENTLAALSNLFIAISIVNPLVIELEDGHWFDSNSNKFLTDFIRSIRKYPVFIIITSRYTDDGKKPKLILDEVLEENNVPTLNIDLNILGQEGIRKFVEARLNGPISKTFQDLLSKATNGNPFYLEQILEYFLESNFLETINQEWTIKDSNIRLSNSINAVLMARIDRLSLLVKETVKAAAVIGREFELPVLSEVMKSQTEFIKKDGNSQAVLKEQIKTAEQGQIWRSTNDLRYIFKHSLLREAAYEMQLHTRLRDLHYEIATAIEKIYKENIEEKYVDLAFHYEQAGKKKKTRKYLERAAEFARANFQNDLALRFYDKILKYQKKSSLLIKTLLNKGSILELIGEWDNCEQVYKKALQKAKKKKDTVLIARCHNNLGNLLILKGNYDKAKKYLEKASHVFEEKENLKGLVKSQGSLGNLYFRQGRYKKAKEFFSKSLDLSKKLDDNFSNAGIVSTLGLTYMNQGQYDEGIACQLEELANSEKRDDKRGQASLNTNLGIVYFEKGDYDAALRHYQKGLSLSEELGNKLLTSIAIGCIGNVYQMKGDYQKAMDHFVTDLEICEQIGDKQGVAIALGLIGELRTIEGDFEIAVSYLEKSLSLCEELNYKKGIAKAVNNLGDIYYRLEYFEKALDRYNQAIDISQEINNKLVLGFSLVEKGLTLLKMDNLEEAQKTNVDALDISKDIGNPQLHYEAQILKIRLLGAEGKTKDATKLLVDLLQSHPEEDREKAGIYYELYKLFPEHSGYKASALKLYEKLFYYSPRYIYRLRKEELK